MAVAGVKKGIDEDRMEAGRRQVVRGLVFIVLLGALLIAFILSLRLGSVRYSTEQIWEALLSSGESTVRTVIVNIRLPRTLLAAMVGANLAMAGGLLQSVMRNPLADPGIIGVSSGAGLAAVAIMLLFPSLSSFVPVAAFLGATAASFLVYILAWKQGVDPVRIVLSGVAVNAVLGGGISMLSLLYSEKIQGVLLWLNGSLSGKTWHQVRMLFPYTLIGIAVAFLCINSANALQLGDEVAKNLGVRVNMARVLLCMMAAFLAGISVSVVGLIGFIGLVVPHICRLLVGSDYKFLMPASAVLGALLLVAGDTVARFAFSPVELPVGIIMAISGGPFFLYLLRKRGAYKI